MSFFEHQNRNGLSLKRLSVRTKVCQSGWKDRVASYCRKINSNQLYLIAEVVSELYPLIKNHIYSMREFAIYQMALDLLTQELAVIDACDTNAALEKIEAFAGYRKLSLMMPLTKS